MQISIIGTILVLVLLGLVSSYLKRRQDARDLADLGELLARLEAERQSEADFNALYPQYPYLDQRDAEEGSPD